MMDETCSVKENFDKFLKEQLSKPSTTLITREKVNLIRSYLSEEATKTTARFRQYVKERRFELRDYAALGLEKVLVTSSASSRRKLQVDSNSLFGGYRRVISCDEIFEVIKSVHEKSTAHSGMRKTFEFIISNYDGIPRVCVEEFCRICPTCSCKKPQITRAPLKPIISKRFHVRGQVDLVDMRSCSDAGYNWIGHYKDHFSKFSIIWPQRKKSAAETIQCLERYVFAYLGVPKLLQSDNGKEFNNSLFELIVQQWCQQTVIIRGRPRHPQSNGCIEQANGTLKHMLQSLMAFQANNREWVKLLPRVQFSMNTQCQASVRAMPYEIVFGIKPSSEPVPDLTVIDEGKGNIYDSDSDDTDADDDHKIHHDDEQDDNAQHHSVDNNEGDDDNEQIIQPDTKSEHTSTGCNGEQIISNSTCTKSEVDAQEQEYESADPAHSGSNKLNSTAATMSATKNCQHGELRKKVQKRILENAERMEKKYNAAKKIKIPAYKLGDPVTVKVPTQDRGPLDLKRIPGVIVKISNGFHKIRTQFGVLKTQYRTDELERCSFMAAEVEGWTDDAVLTLREAARKFNKRTNDVAVCKCKSTCTSRKCKCFKNGIRCTTRCHSGFDCSNKATDCESTDIKDEGCTDTAHFDNDEGYSGTIQQNCEVIKAEGSSETIPQMYNSPDWDEFQQYLEDSWRLDEPVFISEDVKKQIASNTSFSAKPIGPISEHVIAEEFHCLMPTAFASSYVVNTNDDAARLRKLLCDYSQPQPSILVYPYSTQRYQDLPINGSIAEALNNENPLIANLLVDHFGHRFSHIHGMFRHSSEDAADNRTQTVNVTLAGLDPKSVCSSIKGRQTVKVDAPGQWVVHARVGSYNLYTQSFLSVLLDNGWVSDEVITCYFKVTLKQHKLEEKAYVMDVAAVNKICNGTFHGSKIFSKIDIANYEKLIGAYNVCNSHWTLLVIDTVVQRILYVDPLGEQKRILSRIQKNWNLYANHQYEKGYWSKNCKCKISNESHVMQRDGSSCGIFVMKFGEAILLNKKWNGLAVLCSDEEVKKCREEIALTLLKHSDCSDDICRVCGQVDGSNYWIQCDKCPRWYHMKCVQRSYKLPFSAEKSRFVGVCCSRSGFFDITDL